VPVFSVEVSECLLGYSWPGNVRELKNVIRRAALLSEGNVVQLKALPLEISTFSKGADLENTLEAKIAKNSNKYDLKNAALEAEYETILEVLKEVNFNKTKAAKILNIDRKTLYNKMKLINLE
jgi:two-component system response regulator HydG